MELEFFCKPGTDLEWFNYWRTFCHNWLLSIGLKDENIRLRDHDPEELCFYSKATTDFEFLFPFGWGELWGVADRTDYDLTQHSNVSGQKLVYREGEGRDMVEYIPYVIEPSLGVERSVLAVLCDAYDEEVVGQDKNGKDDIRVVMHFHPALAPFKAAILPLSKKEVLSGPAMELYNELSKEFMVDYDETGSIGKRYRRQDEIGTPYCITLDFETVGDENTPADHCVTIRERDTMEQVRIPCPRRRQSIRRRDKIPPAGSLCAHCPVRSRRTSPHRPPLGAAAPLRYTPCHFSLKNASMAPCSASTLPCAKPFRPPPRPWSAAFMVLTSALISVPSARPSA